MTDIVPIHGGSIPNQPSPELIETLEGLLQSAKSGDLVGIAFATVRKENVLGTGWDGMAGTRYTLCTAINMLSHRYNAAMLE